MSDAYGDPIPPGHGDAQDYGARPAPVETCPTCDGTGRNHASYCPECGGAGTVPVEHFHVYGKPYHAMVGAAHVTRQDCACGAFRVTQIAREA